MKIVPAAGCTPNRVLLVGEAPGREEAYRGQPFVGRSGKEQEWYLSRHNLTAQTWRRTNVVQEFTEGNPDPTPEQVERWTPELMRELSKCQPEIVIAVGRFAARWFLGDGVDMEAVHGLPHRAGAFDNGRADRGGPRDALIVPIYHPAFGLHNGDVRGVIEWDYGQVAKYVKMDGPAGVQGHGESVSQDDCYYADVTGGEMEDIIDRSVDTVWGFDTEGTPDDPWSVQVSGEEGTGLVLRCSQPDFAQGIAALQRAFDNGAICVLHNALYDIEMARVMGLELSRAKLFDTMYLAYLSRLEPQGLKPLAYRMLGMRMGSYSDTVGDVGRKKQIDYLREVERRADEWSMPEPQVLIENDGTTRLYKPQHIAKTVKRCLADIDSGKVDKDGNIVDPLVRWKKMPDVLTAEVESVMGKMPIGTLADIPLVEAVVYAGRDADAELRLFNTASQVMKERYPYARSNIDRLMSEGMGVLPVFEAIQYNGMPASRCYFEDLSDRMTNEMLEIGAQISKKYYGGKPFNPKSDKQTRSLLLRLGLEGKKKTDSGLTSTSKKSIEYMRQDEDAISRLFECRERMHVRDSFCAPVLAAIPEGEDLRPVRCTIKTTRTASRRPSAADPNLLNIPTRSDIGKLVRKGYIAPPGKVFGSWDLSQIEYRVMAHFSEDELLCRFFCEGRDIHAETAALVIGKPIEDVTDDERRAAKTINFGIIYGMMEDGMLITLQAQGMKGWTKQRCAEMRSGVFRVYKGMKEYVDRVESETRETGIALDCWGMPRCLPGIWHYESGIAAEAARHAVSLKIQGGAQGMIQRSMEYLKPVIWAMQDAGMNIDWSLQVYDEVIMLFDEELWEVIDPIVIDALTKEHGMGEMRVPILAEGHRAGSWGELK